jgi:hypothetical protein
LPNFAIIAYFQGGFFAVLALDGYNNPLPDLPYLVLWYVLLSPEIPYEGNYLPTLGAFTCYNSSVPPAVSSCTTTYSTYA